MDKLFKRIKENTFEPAGGGGSGALNYQTPYGTPGGGNYSQNPSHFSSSDKTTNHFEPNTASGSSVPKLTGRPDVINKSPTQPVDRLDTTTSPAAAAEKLKSEKPLDPTKEFDPQVDQLFQKKNTPSPDEVMAGLQYELTNMTTKDKTIAKQIVLKNLKKDDHFYSHLDMLNIDDDKMKVDESTFIKTKNVLDQMIFDNKNRIRKLPNLNRIFESLIKKRNYGK